MINVKDQVYEALSNVFDNVSDFYPLSWENLPIVQYTEEANNVMTKTDDEEKYAQLRYRIDIWNTGSTSQLAVDVDNALKVLGLTRVECADVPDPSNHRHKQMRYEGIIDVNTQQVYWTGNR